MVRAAGEGVLPDRRVAGSSPAPPTKELRRFPRVWTHPTTSPGDEPHGVKEGFIRSTGSSQDPPDYLADFFKA